MAASVVGSLGFARHIQKLQYHQASLGGWLHLAKYHLQTNQFNLSETSKLLNLDLHFEPVSDSQLSYLEQQQVLLGQTIVQIEEEGFRVNALLNKGNEPWVVGFELNKLTTRHIEGIFQLLADSLPKDEKGFIQQLTELNRKWALPIHILSPEKTAIHASSAAIAPKFTTEFYLDARGPRFMSYFPQPNVHLVMGPLEFHPTLSAQTILVALLFAVVLSGLSVYWLVQKYELGLQRLERASSRVASGHLNSRVKVASQDSIGRLGSAFNRMAEQIQRLMGVQKEMIRAVSHELRTPVARMRFGVQMLEDTVEDSYVQKQLGDMDQDLQELDELVDEILTYARLEEGGPILEFKSANVLELIQQIQEETKRRTDKVSITCHSDQTAEHEIFSDIEYRYMHRAVQNLVGNACRYAKGQVHIEYSFHDDICRIDVEDDGEGIPEKDWDRVFSPFTRLDDSRTRASGGYGLGLSIVRRIIYWHAGRAQVSKSRWGGAKMSLIWPKSMH